VVEVTSAQEEQAVPHHPATRWRREFAWRLTGPDGAVPFGPNAVEPITGTALPSWMPGDEMALWVGCLDRTMVVAAFDQVSAFDLPGGGHRWTRRLTRPIDAGTLLGDPAVRCYRLDVEDRVATLPNGDEDSRGDAIDVRTGEFTR
jgi:hypothetical protein